MCFFCCCCWLFSIFPHLSLTFSSMWLLSKIFLRPILCESFISQYPRQYHLYRSIFFAGYYCIPFDKRALSNPSSCTTQNNSQEFFYIMWNRKKYISGSIQRASDKTNNENIGLGDIKLAYSRALNNVV